jgi:hypothetical protein
MSELFLNSLYSCEQYGYKKNLNCQYWSVDTNTCTSSCSLKKINPTPMNCFMCKERVSVEENVIKQKPLTAKKAASYLKAESSQIFGGRVSEEVFEKRKTFCLSCEKRVNPEPQNESIGWCQTCGCGVNKRAALSQKLYMPTISCPLNKFGPEKGEGFSVSDAKNAVEGIISSVASIIKETNTDKDK